MSVNKAILIGNLGKDPELRTLDGGARVATFSIATTEKYTKDGQTVENTDWHNIVAWNGLADVAGKYLTKGSPVYIEGKIRSRSYDDKDGVKRYVTEVIAGNLTLLGRKSDPGNSVPPPPADQAPVKSAPSGSQLDPKDDDLPF